MTFQAYYLCSHLLTIYSFKFSLRELSYELCLQYVLKSPLLVTEVLENILSNNCHNNVLRKLENGPSSGRVCLGFQSTEPGRPEGFQWFRVHVGSVLLGLFYTLWEWCPALFGTNLKMV